MRISTTRCQPSFGQLCPSHRRVAEQVRDALPRVRQAYESHDHFESGAPQALIFGGGAST